MDLKNEDGGTLSVELKELSELSDLNPRRCLNCGGLVRESEQVLATDYDHPDYEYMSDSEIRDTYGIGEDEDLPLHGLMRASILSDGDDENPTSWHPPDRGRTILDPGAGRFCRCGSSQTRNEADLHRKTLSNGELFETMDGIIAALKVGDIPFDQHLLEEIVKLSRKEFDRLSGYQFTVLQAAVHYAQAFAWTFPWPDMLTLPVTHPPRGTAISRMTDTDQLARRQVFEPDDGGGMVLYDKATQSPHGKHKLDFKRREWSDEVSMAIQRSVTDSDSGSNTSPSPYPRDNYFGG
jgi:hypothetical protein